MKPKVILIYIDRSAKLGIIPYLSSLFHSYLDFECQLFDQLNMEKLKNCQLILLSSPLCRSLVEEKISSLDVPVFQCRRELNYTHLHKILEIPSGTDVCIVNDRKKNCEAIKNSLLSLGFSQYRYCIYYPGAPSVSPEIQYAITPGEAHFTPPTIKYVIDIGNRNVDIATLSHIVTTFHLPEDILNQVTGNFAGYIGNFMRYITTQIKQLTARSYDNGILLDYLDCGICITDLDGLIIQVNSAFCELFGLEKAALSDRLLSDVLSEYDRGLKMENIVGGTDVCIKNNKDILVDFYFSKTFRSASSEQRYLFFAAVHNSEASEIKQAPLTRKKTSSDFSSFSILEVLKQNERFAEILQLAKIYAETESPVILVGEPGLYQISIARFLHAHSSHSEEPFLYLDSAVNHAASFSASSSQPLLDWNSCGTIFIDHLDQAPAAFQYFLSSFLKMQNRPNQNEPLEKRLRVRIVCSCSVHFNELLSSESFLPELFYQLGTFILKLSPVREMRNEIPSYLYFYCKKFFPVDFQHLEAFFSAQLLHFLKSYDYPGNFQEMENLCHYFSCIYRGEILALNQLPQYIDYKASENRKLLSPQQKEILTIIQEHPHCGRNKLGVLLAENGFPLTMHQIRIALGELSEKGYLDILKTKQGCLITELGEYMLKKE